MPYLTRAQMTTTALAHPFELALGLVLVVNALRGLLHEVWPSIAALPDPVSWAYLLVSGAGGAALVVGLLMESRQPLTTRKALAPISLGAAIERSALFVVAGSYAALGAAVVMNNPARGAGTAILSLLVAIACVLRAVAIRRTTKIVLAQNRAAR